jgi:uncharacterized membrane protein (UPF0136 family)
MKIPGVIGVIYGALILVGGALGYLTAGSLVSALARGGCGMGIVLSGWAMLKGKSAGWYATLAMAAVLTAFFGARFWQGGAFMPTGLMAVLSLLTVALLLMASTAGKRTDAPH